MGLSPPLLLIQLRDSIGDRAADVVGEISIEVIDLYLDVRGRVCVDRLRKVRRDSQDGDHVQVLVQRLRLGRRRIAHAKEVGLMDDLRHLLAARALIERHQRHRTAADRPRRERGDCEQRKGGEHRDRHISRLAQPDAQIFFANRPGRAHKCL
jgi:hypothetical protein